MSDMHRLPDVIDAAPAELAPEAAAGLGSGVWALACAGDRVFFDRAGDAAELAQKCAALPRLIELRLFSEAGAVRFGRAHGAWKCRAVFDDGKEADDDSGGRYLKTVAMWGTETRTENGQTVMLEEGRGNRFGFPLAVDKERLPLKLALCNYYRYDPNGILDFYDVRLVKIVDKNGGEL